MKTDENLQYMPRSLKLWAQIEQKAQERAEERFKTLQEMKLRKIIPSARTGNVEK